MGADTSIILPACTNLNTSGEVTNTICTCGTAGTANPGDYCSISSNTIIPKCTDGISACIVNGTSCPITNRGCVCDGTVAVIGQTCESVNSKK